MPDHTKLTRPTKTVVGTTSAAAITFSVFELLQRIQPAWIPYIASGVLLLILLLALIFYLYAPSRPHFREGVSSAKESVDPLDALADAIAERRRHANVTLVFGTLIGIVGTAGFAARLLVAPASQVALWVSVFAITIVWTFSLFFVMQYRVLRAELRDLDERRVTLSTLLSLLEKLNDGDPNRREVVKRLLDMKQLPPHEAQQLTLP